MNGLKKIIFTICLQIHNHKHHLKFSVEVKIKHKPSILCPNYYLQIYFVLIFDWEKEINLKKQKSEPESEWLSVI